MSSSDIPLMDDAEAKVVEVLANRRIVWSDAALSCPQGLYVCDAFYHGESAYFESTKEVKRFGFVLDEDSDNCIVFSIIQHGRELDLSSVRFEGDYGADTGGLLLLNGPVEDMLRSKALRNTIDNGIPRERIVSPSSTVLYGPTRCGGEDCFVINAGWGSGGYDVYHSPTCHILDHKHIRWDVRSNRASEK